jgi:glycosyltransferase involved in cell wall biosynthesis
VLFGFDDLASNLALLNLKSIPKIKFVSLGKPNNSSPISNIFFFNFSFLPKIRAEKLDLFFSPHFERGIPIRVTKTAVMMHDVIPLVTNKYSQKGFLFNIIKGMFYKKGLKQARKADIILTNSEFSKRELINKAGFNESKVNRIYLGVKDDFRKENISQDMRDIRRILTIYNIVKPYILYYGGIEANKNISVLLTSFRNAIQRFPDLKLVLVGKEFKVGWDNKVTPLTKQAKNVISLINDLKLKHNIIFSGQIDNSHLPIVLNNSKLFIHLSTYEGFGLSVLEALAAGIPVITTRRSSNPEIFEDSVTYVPVKEVNKISESIIQLLEDENYRDKMIKMGLLQSRKYNWAVTAKETLSVFEYFDKKIEKLNIAYVIPNFYPFKGGAENNCLALARSMVSQGHKVSVLTSNSNNLFSEAFENYEGIDIFRFNKKNSEYYLGYYPGLLKKLLTSRYDVIHVHGFGFIWQDFCLIIKKMFSSKKVIFINTPHGPFMANDNYNFPQKILKVMFTFIMKRYLYFLYKIVIEVNPEQVKWIKKLGINKKKVIFLPNGIDKEYLVPIEYQDELVEHKLNKKFVISYLGRFEKYKGIQDVIEVLPEIVKEHKNLVFVAMGNKGAYSETIEKLIEEKGLQNNVRLIYSPSDISVKKILTLSNIFILPSSWEAFGISILEAMATNNAIISTRTEGGEFLIKEEENGFLYDYQDKGELRTYLEKLIDNKILLNKIKKNNYLKVQQFLWSQIGLDYQKIIQKYLIK